MFLSARDLLRPSKTMSLNFLNKIDPLQQKWPNLRTIGLDRACLHQCQEWARDLDKKRSAITLLCDIAERHSAKRFSLDSQMLKPSAREIKNLIQGIPVLVSAKGSRWDPKKVDFPLTRLGFNLLHGFLESPLDDLTVIEMALGLWKDTQETKAFAELEKSFWG